jgi:uncharacterized protein DUF3800
VQEPLSRTMHLLSVRGAKWREVLLAAFNVYIDDSGTDPKQKIAIASCIVIPAVKIPAMDREWETLKGKEHFSDFHTSQCVANNSNSDFADWDCGKKRRVLLRVRQITKKYAVQAVSFAVNKLDYEQLASPEIKEFTGKHHYAWAVENVLNWIDTWADRTKATLPFEYVYDSMDKGARRDEIDGLMIRMENFYAENGEAGRYSNYGFRRREDIPALQCADLMAWTCYQRALRHFGNTPMHYLASESFADFKNHSNKKYNEPWFLPTFLTRDNFKSFCDSAIEGRSLKHFRELKDSGKLTVKRRNENKIRKPRV